MIKFLKRLIALFLIVGGIAFVLRPTSINMPVEGATSKDYNNKSFWCPWGDHHHHGIDIFAKVGTPIRPARAGVVIAVTHNSGHGGNTISILDYSGTIYYYAHLDSIASHIGAFVGRDTVIGTVGKTGNAANTPAHLHFSMLSVWPKIHESSEYDKKHYKDDHFKWLFHNPAKLLKQ